MILLDDLLLLDNVLRTGATSDLRYFSKPARDTGKSNSFNKVSSSEVYVYDFFAYFIV